MTLIQLLKFKTWETRLFKMPCFETPHFQTGTRETVASGLNMVAMNSLLIWVFADLNSHSATYCVWIAIVALTGFPRTRLLLAK